MCGALVEPHRRLCHPTTMISYSAWKSLVVGNQGCFRLQESWCLTHSGFDNLKNLCTSFWRQAALHLSVGPFTFSNCLLPHGQKMAASLCSGRHVYFQMQKKEGGKNGNNHISSVYLLIYVSIIRNVKPLSELPLQQKFTYILWNLVLRTAQLKEGQKSEYWFSLLFGHRQ